MSLFAAFQALNGHDPKSAVTAFLALLRGNSESRLNNEERVRACLGLSHGLQQLGRLIWASGVLNQTMPRLTGFTIETCPFPVPALRQKARIELQRGLVPDAIALLLKANAIAPNDIETLGLLGTGYAQAGQFEDAVLSLQAAVDQAPDNPIYALNLGLSLAKLQRLDPALELLSDATERFPGMADLWSALGDVQIQIGDAIQAVQSHASALKASSSHPRYISNYLLSLTYLDIDPDKIAQQHIGLGRLFGAGASFAPPSQPSREQSPKSHTAGRMRIGFLSPDLRHHATYQFLRSYLRAYDATRFEVYLYALSKIEDSATQEARALADHWRDAADLPLATLASMIRGDALDVLVDACGHFAMGRPEVFPLRLAPLQIAWIGYPATSGLPGMDLRIVDDLTDPIGLTEDHHSEVLVRLDGGFLCYTPPDSAPTPFRERDTETGKNPRAITFGSFNNLAKVSNACLDLWSATLLALPDSRLALKARGLSAPSMRTRILDALTSRGISPERVSFLDFTPTYQAHLNAYSKIDIALDTTPYNGTTTTCEALWMGVPVVTLPGRDHRSRVGMSLLTNANSPEWCAENLENFVQICEALSSDTQTLIDFRENSRRALRQSALLDSPRLARTFESALLARIQRSVQRD